MEDTRRENRHRHRVHLEGIGRATALELARHGVHLVISARTLEALEQTCTQAQALGVKVLPIACDVSKLDEVENLIHAALATDSRALRF